MNGGHLTSPRSHYTHYCFQFLPLCTVVSEISNFQSTQSSPTVNRQPDHNSWHLGEFWFPYSNASREPPHHFTILLHSARERGPPRMYVDVKECSLSLPFFYESQKLTSQYTEVGTCEAILRKKRNMWRDLTCVHKIIIKHNIHIFNPFKTSLWVRKYTIFIRPHRLKEECRTHK